MALSWAVLAPNDASQVMIAVCLAGTATFEQPVIAPLPLSKVIDPVVGAIAAPDVMVAISVTPWSVTGVPGVTASETVLVPITTGLRAELTVAP